ncbi:hypothetical protein KBX14_00895 [Corynebacterium sp. CCUG 61414]|uniref:Or membrane protein n=1 Tax=Corynebacterium pseudogenitalium TaxID=38303 RepID=A0ABD4TM34_9CORY|nr:MULTISPECIES: hypothetical protein [Corynebacterium]MCQ4608988.1 hypothetical protein [Corynebacterium sp. CCUG 61414]MCQ4613398.1 hypothetical protein [Corynebacterium pseudogenitalium]
MRNFRTAAVASATALTVALGGIATASAAEDNAPAKDTKVTTTTTNTPKPKADRQVIFTGKQDGDKDFSKVVSDGTKGLFNKGGSSHYFDQKVNDNKTDNKDMDQPFYITDAFGKKTDAAAVPQWARYWIDGTVIAGIGALVGLIIAGFNFASYNGLIKL